MNSSYFHHQIAHARLYNIFIILLDLIVIILSAIKTEIDFILLSHPTLQHLGALPYACCQLGLNAPIYATVPTAAMGLLLLEDAYVAYKQQSNFDAYNLQDVKNLFENITRVRYSQSIVLPGTSSNFNIFFVFSFFFRKAVFFVFYNLAMQIRIC